MTSININLLTNHREPFLELTLFLLNRIKPQNKKAIRLNIIASGGSARRFRRLLSGINGIEVHVQTAFTQYLDKVRWAAGQPCRYQARLDEDVFVGPSVLDYMIENVGLLDNSDYLTLSPMLSNGIPTTDEFLVQFFGSKDRQEIERELLATEMPEVWGVDYRFLNRHTTRASRWNAVAFYRSVASLDHYLKGIHPVRISSRAQWLINDLLIGQGAVRQFLNPTNLSIQEIEAPYLCNNFFFIRASEWKKILWDQTLFRDPFDEIPLSLYKQRSGAKFGFVRNGFAIHTMYNTVGSVENDRRELQFFLDLKNQVYAELGHRDVRELSLAFGAHRASFWERVRKRLYRSLLGAPAASSPPPQPGTDGVR